MGGEVELLLKGEVREEVRRIVRGEVRGAVRLMYIKGGRE